MDDNARRRRQERPGSSTSNTRFSIHDPSTSRRSYGAGGLDQYRRPPSLNASAPVPRSMGATAAYGAYYQEPTTTYSQAMPQSTIAYQPDYGQDNRQTQGYGTYNSPMIYNVPQAGAQNAVYDTSQQFSSRQAAGLQMMPADVAAPYFPSEPANAAAAASLQPQTAPSTTQTVYQQNTTDQRMLHQNYPSGMVSMSGMAQTAAPEQAVEEQEYTAPASASAPAPATTTGSTAQMGEAYEQYQSALREVFTNIQNGALQTASESLLDISEWLLTKVVELGLTADQENLHQDRLKLWRDFNNAWLSLCQKQKTMLESSLPLQRGQNLVSEEQMMNMGNELVRLCSSIERHGLVDYEYGVWEERIIDILGQCLDALENSRSSGVARSSQQGSSRIGST
ncbi:hypothetical protein F5Y14DRAFT_380387 [Nemania sp. NC0429]|nr:hypothetical protein F5Y14DRAFT_380387 [Nemania sp. NC0429]